jgi:hypothetical protein
VIGHPRFRPIAAILAEQPVKAAYLDGKIAVLTSEGISNFEALQEALGWDEGGPVAASLTPMALVRRALETPTLALP